jgi:cell wall-associated NlpC family hydrolase
VGTGRTEPATGISRIGYSIQVGAFSEVRNAERLTAKLQDKGIEAFYFKRENGFYAVRFGDFPHRDDARKAAKKLVSEQIIGSYFIAPPQITAKASLPQEKDWKKPAVKTKKDRDMGFIAARTAERFVGIPYRWGGNTVVDGMDCSGFARAVYNLCGVNIPRTSSEQYKIGQKIDKNELEDGDLVFFGGSESQITHVGIYVGNNRFVHAPKRGEDIKISTLNDNGFSKRFMGGRRYF